MSLGRWMAANEPYILTIAGLSSKIAGKTDASGAVCSAAVASNDLSNPNVASCIANLFRASGHFPTPHGGCVDANVPISLMPPGQR